MAEEVVFGSDFGEACPSNDTTAKVTGNRWVSSGQAHEWLTIKLKRPSILTRIIFNNATVSDCEWLYKAPGSDAWEVLIHRNRPSYDATVEYQGVNCRAEAVRFYAFAGTPIAIAGITIYGTPIPTLRDIALRLSIERRDALESAASRAEDAVDQLLEDELQLIDDVSIALNEHTQRQLLLQSHQSRDACEAQLNARLASLHFSESQRTQLLRALGPYPEPLGSCAVSKAYSAAAHRLWDSLRAGDTTSVYVQEDRRQFLRAALRVRVAFQEFEQQQQKQKATDA
eukprot:TRINITY_DN10433_c0_g1_i1.p1 TRINITY_DN10433_c0_g1~~TRINITY_DN10433_c0_g1_i1.p1  ORF type:complete len:285 (+),score=45.63 TRINITY_DN10433_c0_g1_i1:113-967(+)